MNPPLKFTIRNIYGRQLCYPVNTPAIKLVDAMGLKTFTPPQITALRAAGVSIMLVAEELDR